MKSFIAVLSYSKLRTLQYIFSPPLASSITTLFFQIWSEQHLTLQVSKHKLTFIIKHEDFKQGEWSMQGRRGSHIFADTPTTVYNFLKFIMITHQLCCANVNVQGCWKTRNGTERNGTGSNWCSIRTWTPDTRWKIGVNMSAHHGTESSSCVLYQPRRRNKHPADSIEPHQAY